MPLVAAIGSDGNVAHITLQDNNPIPEWAAAAILDRSLQIADENGFDAFALLSAQHAGQERPQPFQPARWTYRTDTGLRRLWMPWG